MFAQVVATELATDMVTLSCLTPPGRARSYQLPDPAVVVTVPRSDVLVTTQVAVTATRRDRFTIPVPDKVASEAAMKERQ